MPFTAAMHPQVVHFVIAFVLGGVLLRWVSLAGRPSWAGPAAAAMLIFGGLAAVPAVSTGVAAHGPAERVPGARPAVQEHEEWGERTRNLLLLIVAVEVLAIGLARSEDRKRLANGATMLSAALGIAAVFFVYETGEQGGELVYAYAGGVGVRSGEPEDISNLLVAGLYHQAVADRAEGRGEDAARLIREMSERRPDDLTVQIMWGESMLRDLDDAESSLAFLDDLSVPEDNTSLTVRAEILRADALESLERTEEASAVLSNLLERYPQNRAVLQRTQPQG
jgi:uncharacterized membrane protein